MPKVGDMTGKVALVTGTASGLGRATALALAKAGADLCIVDRNEAGLYETASFLGATRVLTHATDLSSAENCYAAVDIAVEAFGRLDALCNVAGMLKIVNSPEMAALDWNLVVAVNLNAPFHLIQRAMPHLLDVEGAVVNVASTAAFVGQAYTACYSATKAGVVGLTKALAMEYMRRPVRINAVAPGGMATAMIDAFQIPDEADLELIGRYSGLRGLVEVDDVADMIAFLASPAAASYHGSCISIDRGITAG